jgi:uncharacterized protein (DUF1330 family)
VNRSLASFLTFLMVLAIAAAGGVWWLGFDLVDLALDEDRRAAPYQLLHFADADAPSGDYAGTLTALVRSEEGDLAWRGGLDRLLDGRSEDEWQDLMIFDLPRGGGLVQLVTSPEFRELTEGRRTLLLGTSAPALKIAQTGNLLVWLQADPEPDDPRRQALDAVTASIGSYGGTLIVQGELDQVAGDSPWNHIAVMSFADAQQARDWFRDPASVTERALATKHLQRQAWLMMTARYLR